MLMKRSATEQIYAGCYTNTQVNE